MFYENYCTIDVEIGRQNETPLECIPREVPVNVPEPEPGFIYYPTCIGLNQCSGCCDDTRLKCSPTTTQPVDREVNEIRFSSLIVNDRLL